MRVSCRTVIRGIQSTATATWPSVSSSSSPAPRFRPVNFARASCKPGSCRPPVRSLHRLGVHLLALADGLIDGRHDQVFDQFAIALGEQLRIDAAAEDFQQAVDLDFDHAAAGRAGRRGASSTPRVSLLHLAADLLGLLAAATPRLPSPLNIGRFHSCLSVLSDSASSTSSTGWAPNSSLARWTSGCSAASSSRWCGDTTAAGGRRLRSPRLVRRQQRTRRGSAARSLRPAPVRIAATCSGRSQTVLHKAYSGLKRTTSRFGAGNRHATRTARPARPTMPESLRERPVPDFRGVVGSSQAGVGAASSSLVGSAHELAALAAAATAAGSYFFFAAGGAAVRQRRLRARLPPAC